MIFISGPFYYVKEHLKAYKYLKIDEEGTDRLQRSISALSSFSLFGNDYILIQNIDKWSKKERESLLPYLNKSAIITCSNIDMREKFFKTVVKKADEKYIFENIKPWETDKWIKYITEVGNSYNLKIDKGVAFEILKIIGENYDRIYSELKKLSSLKTGSITLEDLQYLSNSVIDFTNSIVESILTRKKPFKEIDAFFKFKMQPITLVYSLMKNYKELLIIKSKLKKTYLSWNEIKTWSKTLKINSGKLAKFVGFSFSKNSKSLDYRKLYTEKEIYKILEKLIELEANIKAFENKSHFTAFIEYLNYEL